MKALALFSGGLDSMLAMRLITAQGIAVKALNINIGFGSRTDKSADMARRAALVGADFAVVDMRSPYLQSVLFSPNYGYGKHFNPCIDCHAFMFKTALAMLESEGASFIITGEVLGQRPMSQRADALNKVRSLAEAGLDEDAQNLVLRPLCAKNLPPTKPEIMGWVDREKLEKISGRSRKRQLELAAEFGLEDFESPGGGCLLTLQSFASKIKDYKAFEPDMGVNDAQLLKYGRHLRLPRGAKMIVGRDELENELLRALKTPKYEEIELFEVVGAYSLVNFGGNLALKLGANSRSNLSENLDAGVNSALNLGSSLNSVSNLNFGASSVGNSRSDGDFDLNNAENSHFGGDFDLNNTENSRGGFIDESDLNLALKIALSYAKTQPEKSYKIGFKGQIYTASPLKDKKEIEKFFVGK